MSITYCESFKSFAELKKFFFTYNLLDFISPSEKNSMNLTALSSKVSSALTNLILSELLPNMQSSKKFECI